MQSEKTITYELVGNYLRKTDSIGITFSPITPETGFFFFANPTDGFQIGGIPIPAGRMTGTGDTIVVKPSYEELKNTIMKKIQGNSSGGRKVTKTRRRVRIV